MWLKNEREAWAHTKLLRWFKHSDHDNYNKQEFLISFDSDYSFYCQKSERIRLFIVWKVHMRLYLKSCVFPWLFWHWFQEVYCCWLNQYLSFRLSLILTMKIRILVINWEDDPLDYIKLLQTCVYVQMAL